jgi:CheY-like chemotaxis protein
MMRIILAAPKPPADRQRYPDVNLCQASTSVVLVVEDDPFIRTNTVEALREYGWTILEAHCAGSAIDIVKSTERIDLVFSDIQMPGELNGIGLACWLRENRPRIRVLLTSGGIPTIDPSLSEEPLISKPYTPSKVADLIRRHLSLTGTLRPRFGTAEEARLG